MINKNRIQTLFIRSSVIITLLIAPPLYNDAQADELLSDKKKLDTIINQQSWQLEEQKKMLQAQEKQFYEYKKQMEKVLAQQQQSIENLKSRLQQSPQLSQKSKQKTKKQSPPAPSSPPQVLTTKKNRTPAQTIASSQKSARIHPVGKAPISSQKTSLPDVVTMFAEPTVLTTKGSLVVEPSIHFSHSSNKRIALVGYTIIPAITIGLIDVRNISRDTFIGALTARYGATNRIELESKIPYIYRTETTTTKPYATQTNLIESSADGDGLGDIEFGIRYQLNKPKDGPFYVGSIRVKSITGTDPFEVTIDPTTNMQTESPTGSGFWGIQPALSVIFPSDPAVFFGSINYMWNIEKNIGQINNINYGTFDPGDSFGFNFGIGLALNEKASYSLGYTHNIISRNRINGKVVPGDINIHVGSFNLGYSYRFKKDVSVNFSLGIGVTDDAPAVQLTLKVPLTL